MHFLVGRPLQIAVLCITMQDQTRQKYGTSAGSPAAWAPLRGFYPLNQRIDINYGAGFGALATMCTLLGRYLQAC